MQIGLYGIRDSKAEAFVHFFNAGTDAVAVRMFEDSVKDPQSNLHRHPEDYSLHRVCRVEQVDASVTPENVQLTTGAVVVALSREE